MSLSISKQHKKAKAARDSARDFKNVHIFAGKFSTGPPVKKRALLRLHISLEKLEKLILKYIFSLKIAVTLVVQENTQFGHSTQIVKIGVEATC